MTRVFAVIYVVVCVGFALRAFIAGPEYAALGCLFLVLGYFGVAVSRI